MAGGEVAATGERLAQSVRSLMPALKDDLARLVAIPSVSSPGYPEPRRPLVDAYDAVVALLRDSGVERLDTFELPDTAPIVTGEIPGPDGTPTVLPGSCSR